VSHRDAEGGGGSRGRARKLRWKLHDYSNHVFKATPRRDRTDGVRGLEGSSMKGSDKKHGENDLASSALIKRWERSDLAQAVQAQSGTTFTKERKRNVTGSKWGEPGKHSGWQKRATHTRKCPHGLMQRKG